MVADLRCAAFAAGSNHQPGDCGQPRVEDDIGAGDGGAEVDDSIAIADGIAAPDAADITREA